MQKYLWHLLFCLFAAAVVVSTPGCVVVKAKKGDVEFFAATLIKDVRVGEVTSSPAGDFRLKGYDGKTNAEAVGRAVGAAVAEALTE
jgi:hypothetical protein